MIKLNDFKKEIDELEPGETIRLDHRGCGAGSDTRRRLYITRVLANPTKVLGYCHNCGESGAWTDKEFAEYRDARHKTHPIFVTPIKIERDVEPLTGLVTNPADWPYMARCWQWGNRVPNSIIYKYGIAYDPNTDMVYLPRWQSWNRRTHDFHGFQGYQLRRVTGTGPKYMTVIKDKSCGYTRLGRGVANRCVVVEDLISGLAILTALGAEPHDDPNTDVFVNYGVRINPLLVAKLATYYQGIMWLDNDSDHVVRIANTYSRTIQLYSNIKMHTIDKDYSDPKHYKTSQILELLDSTWTV